MGLLFPNLYFYTRLFFVFFFRFLRLFLVQKWWKLFLSNFLVIILYNIKIQKWPQFLILQQIVDNAAIRSYNRFLILFYWHGEERAYRDVPMYEQLPYWSLDLWPQRVFSRHSRYVLPPFYRIILVI